MDKPEWFIEMNPAGAVPVIELPDGKVLYESAICCGWWMFFVAVVAFVSRSLVFDAKGTHDSHLTFRPMIAEPIDKTVQIWFAKKL